MQASTSSSAGRPRSDLNAAVFAATLRMVDELGYAGATMDRIAAAAGTAKTTLYRRWPSKGALIIDTLLDAFSPMPALGQDRPAALAQAVRWLAAKVGEPGVGAAFAGVFSDAVNDAALRELLSTRFQEPYLIVLKDYLGESEQRIVLFIDVITGTLLHRMGMTGRPMADADVEAMIAMVLSLFE
ncbi:TetR-like C-terminal domain-containing protein [Glycomyces arizonensis]|uniref:TetR-like C-terminal domain-containing protein n=1 Tax=Glycomyces arizonensis TaxID=256035 RepID=UPI000400F160|nr:TetR-like C-terminal domain-containing protein [Glycomyces arizonensis]